MRGEQTGSPSPSEASMRKGEVIMGKGETRMHGMVNICTGMAKVRPAWQKHGKGMAKVSSSLSEDSKGEAKLRKEETQEGRLSPIPLRYYVLDC